VGGYDGNTEVSSLTTATGLAGKAFSFNGTSDFIDLDANAAALATAGSRTLEMLIDLESDACQTIFQIELTPTRTRLAFAGWALWCRQQAEAGRRIAKEGAVCG
jgi:hypothetical protein